MPNHPTNHNSVRTPSPLPVESKSKAADFLQPQPINPVAPNTDEFLASTLANLADGFVVFDREWRYTYVNPAAARILSKRCNELLGRVVWDVFPEARNLPVYEHFQRAVRERCPIQFEMYHPGLGWFEDRCQPTADGLAVYFSEITHRKEMEETLRASQQRLDLACAAAQIGVWDWDLTTNELHWNLEHYRIWGVDETTFKPTVESANQALHPEDRAGLWAVLQHAREDRRFFEHEYRIIRSHGEVRWLMSMGRAFYDNNGHPVRMSGAVRDITRRKHTEHELQRLSRQLKDVNADLEHKVAERTARLQETVSELERFSYALTHDMRAPLRAMRGFSDILIEDCTGQLDPEHVQLLQRIASAAGRMDTLIVDALQYHKAIQAEFIVHPVDIGKLLREMVQSYPQFQHPLAEISIAENMPMVQANRAALTQCFSNLLNNAIKFVQPGRISAVNIWAEPRGDDVRIWFEDNGIGIAPERQEQIWHMFERLAPDYPGTGIGLALVRKLAEQMHGGTGVESAPGQGSRFWIQLPAAAHAR